MFEGTNTITLCKAALMKIVEDYINQTVYTPRDRLTITDCQLENATWTAKFTVVSRPKPEDEEESK